MFGYVRPALSRLAQQDRDAYQGAYCGLCHAMGSRHGFLSRFALNYDFTFLAILFTADGADEWREKRCPAHPLRKCRSCLCGRALERAADASLLLTWHKLRDDVRDKGWFRGLPARFLSCVFSAAAARARKTSGEFSAQTERGLERLHELEAKASPELDRAADSFARILQAAAPKSGDTARQRAMEQLLYHVGRWIYLVDAWDDLEEDRARGQYNPLDARFQGRAAEHQEYIAVTMTHSLRLAVSAANLLELGCWRGVVENILYQGLPAVQEAVLSGRWKQMRKRMKRNGETNE